MLACDMISILALACGIDSANAEGLAITHVRTARELLHALRLMQFDAIVSEADTDEEAPVWTLLKQVRSLRPQVPWFMIADDHMTTPMEILARSLGASLIDRSDLTAWDLARRMSRLHRKPVQEPFAAV